MRNIKPTYKKVIPLNKFQKIFYPRRYMESATKCPYTETQHSFLDYGSLVDKELYGIKNNRINSIHNYARSTHINTFKPIIELVNTKLERNTMIDITQKENEEKSGTINFYNSLPTKRNKEDKKLKDELLTIRPYANNKNNTFDRFSIINKGNGNNEKLDEEIGCQWDLTNGDITNYKTADPLSSEVKFTRYKNLENVERILKYMMEKHTPILTRNEFSTSKYKKAYRKKIEMFMVENFNKTQEFKPKDEKIISPSIPKKININKDNNKLLIKNSYDKNKRNALKLNKVDLSYKKSALNKTNLMDLLKKKSSNVFDNFPKKRIVHGNLGIAINDYPKDFFSFITPKRNSSTIRKKKSELNITVTKEDVSKSIESVCRVAGKLRKMKKILKSIENTDKEIKNYSVNVHRYSRNIKLPQLFGKTQNYLFTTSQHY